MMKRHIISEIVTIKPLTYKELTSDYDGVMVNYTEVQPDDPGFLVCHTNSLKFEWVPEKEFKGIPFDDFTEVMQFYSKVLDKFASFLKEHNKKKKPSKEQRNIIYTMNKHLKALLANCNKLIE